MQVEQFVAAYNQPRNGANFFVRHWWNKKFQYSDGVQECAETGLHWVLDKLATEVAPLVKVGDLGIVKLKTAGDKVTIELHLEDGEPPAWTTTLTGDAPPGEWIFYLTNEDVRWALILPSEY